MDPKTNSQPVPRILITRLSHIGDCVLTLPLLSAIRREHPDAFIAWAVESPTQQLLELHPDLDEIIQIPKGWLRKPKHYLNLRRKFKRLNFDIAIDPQGITKSAALGWISGAKKRIGIKGRWGRELSPYLNNSLVQTTSEHIVERSLELLSKISFTTNQSKTNQHKTDQKKKGEPNTDNANANNANNANHNHPANINFGLPVCPTSHTSIESWLSQNVWKQQNAERFVLINPGGSWASKRWEMDRYGAVASYLKIHHDLTSVIVWAGVDEFEMAKKINSFDTNASIIAPRTNLRELASLTSRASFFIGGDTGPMHIASAMGTPCVGLYGTTRPEESGAFGPHHIAVQKWYQSGSCRKRRNAANDAMKDILASDVFSACDQMIASLSNKSKWDSQSAA